MSHQEKVAGIGCVIAAAIVGYILTMPLLAILFFISIITE